MQSLSEPGAQRPTMGAYLLGKIKTWKNTFRNRELLLPILWAFSSSNLELLCYDSGPVLLQLNSLHRGEPRQKEPTEDTGLFFMPYEGSFRGRRQEMYFFLLHLTNNERNLVIRKHFFK